MRVIKLSPKDRHMKTMCCVRRYFNDTLNGKEDGRPIGEFRMKKINKVKGLCPGDRLVFSYRKPNERSKIVYVAIAETGVYKNRDGINCFRINMGKVVEGVGKTLKQLQEKLRECRIYEKSLLGQAWNYIEIGDKEARKILQDFIIPR